jgi:GT2 family glycosyltransferase
MRFSVVIPLYNKRPHIERALTSVFRQTLAPVEIIVVDDGSTDGGYEWVKGLAHGNVLHEQRGEAGPGGYAARNRGIEIASGEWIAFLDADDEWRPEHLSGLAHALEAQKQPDAFTILFSGYESFFEGGSREIDAFSRKHFGTARVMSFRELIDEWIIYQNSPVWTSATACRRRTLLDAGLFPADRCRRGGDKDTWLRVASLGSLLFTGQVTANYHRDAVNMTTSKKYSNTVPCSVPTLDSLAKTKDPEFARKLAHLKNLEIFNYAMVSARTEGLASSSFANFDGRIDPWRLALLRLLSNPIGKAAAQGAFWSRRLLRGR